MAENNTNGKLLERLFGPSADKLGNALANIDEPLKYIYATCRDFVSGEQENSNKLKDLISEKTQDIPSDQLTPPPKGILIPLLQLNSYTDDDDLRSLYANLLSNSMNKQYNNHAHPSFIETIKQLSPNEALLLKTSKLLMGTVATCEIRYQEVSTYSNPNKWALHPANIMRDVNPGTTIYQYYIPTISNVPLPELQIMIENFIRLSLVTCPLNKILLSKDSYCYFFKDKLHEQLESQYKDTIAISKKGEISHIPHYLEPTAYGKMFYEICVK